MALDYGKAFEQRFKEDWLDIPDSSIDRLYDTMNGFKSISQISDFIGYLYPNIFYLECKSKSGNTFPLSNLTQYNQLLSKMGIYGVRTGAIIWFYDHDKIVYVPIKTFKKLKEDGKKSVNIRTLEKEGYDFVDIPAKKLRVFMKADYSVLKNLPEGW